MTWWLSLLIAILPATVTGVISWAISRKEINKIILELETKYKYDNKIFINQTRFDLELTIYKTISEKLTPLIIKTLGLFPLEIYYNPTFKNTARGIYEERYELIDKLYREAEAIICQNAIFISTELFKDYEEILRLSREQIKAYCEIHLFYNEKYNENDYKEKTKTIEEKYNNFIEKQRKYIESLDVKEK